MSLVLDAEVFHNVAYIVQKTLHMVKFWPFSTTVEFSTTVHYRVEFSRTEICFSFVGISSRSKVLAAYLQIKKVEIFHSKMPHIPLYF